MAEGHPAHIRATLDEAIGSGERARHCRLNLTHPEHAKRKHDEGRAIAPRSRLREKRAIPHRDALRNDQLRKQHDVADHPSVGILLNNPCGDVETEKQDGRHDQGPIARIRQEAPCERKQDDDGPGCAQDIEIHRTVGQVIDIRRAQRQSDKRVIGPKQREGDGGKDQNQNREDGFGSAARSRDSVCE